MEEKKLEVIPIAIRLFSEKGYNATSVEEIAKEVGMAKGSFYRLFDSKEDLLLEIFTLIPKQIKAGLTKIYSKKVASTHERLSDFICLSLDILSNQEQLLMDTVFIHPVFKNKETVQKAEQMKLEGQMWLKEFFLELYGDKVKDYIADLVSLLPGLIFQYVHLFRCQKSELEPERLANFIATIFDILVEGMVERKPEPILDIEWAALGKIDYDSPRLKGQKIQLLLKRMTYTVKGLKMEVEEQGEYVKTICLLEEECTKIRPESFLLKALIHYLRDIAEIQEDCAELKILLEIESSHLEEIV